MNHPYRVLVVEDDIDVIDMLSLYLSEHGFQVEGVSSGEEAVARCLEISPHVILLDITLVDIDGYEVCSRLRHQPRTAHIPIIFLTKRDKRSERLMGLELGADDYITKPFDLEELLLRVRGMVQRRERQSFTDPVTGLPGDRFTRTQVERALSEAERAVVRLSIDHARAFREAYGPLAYSDVRVYVAGLLLKAVNALGRPRDFVGTLDQDNYVAIASPDTARAIGEYVAGAFNPDAGKHYPETDRRRGYLDSHGIRAPLMQLRYEVYTGDDKAGVLHP